MESDSEVRCVLVRGAGERAFCAGTDLHSLDDFADDGLGGIRPTVRSVQRVS